MLTDALVAFDHLKHTVTILANAYVEEEGVEAGYERALGVHRRGARAARRPAAAARTAPPAPEPHFEPNMPREAFEAMVARIVEYVHAGDAFQVVPSPALVGRGRRRPVLDLPRPARDQPVAVHVLPRLRGLPDRRRVARAARHRHRRPRDDAADRRHAAARRRRRARTRRSPQDLLADEKERAEHVMLVDLGRNDLGRVCEYGSVEVETFMAVETYSHLIHIVSSVGGRLRAEVGPMDALRSILPAGTLSGAPKVRAMQIIDELEPVKRGAYGGAVGYLSYTGELDTCICIRTVVLQGRRRAHAGRRRHRRRRQARLRVRGVAQQGARRRARDRARDAPGGVALTRSSSSTTTTRSPTTSSSTWASWGAELEVVRNDVETTDELLARRPDRVIVSPGPCTPNEAGVSVEVMRRFPEAGVPTLGVCLGHQSLAQAFGGTVDPPRAGARQDDGDHPRRHGAVRRAAVAADRRPLPLARGRPRRCRTA